MNRLHQIFNGFTKNERSIFLAAVSVFLITGILWTVFIIQNSTTEIPVKSKWYKEGIVGQPIAINPVLAGNNDVDRDLIELLFSGLIDLSENYKISPDGQTWNIILKPDLHWSDGKPLTSEDVIFTIDAIQNSDSRSPLFLTWQGIITDRISEREIEFTIRTPYAFFLDNLRDLKIIPKHIFGSIPVENFRLSSFNLEPVGNGPYKFDEFEKRSDGFITNYLLSSNKYFSGGDPYIEKIEVKFYQDNSQLIKAFNLKKVDGFGGLNPGNLEELRLGYKLLEKSIPQYYAIFINKNSNPSLTNQKILSALNLATNKEKIVNQVFKAKATVINEPILPIISGYDASADPGSEFSTEKAALLLDEEGWIKNEKNIREKKIGKQVESLEYSIVVPQIPFIIETINIIKNDWDKIGIKLNPIILNPADIANEVIKTRNYQMIIFGNILRNNPDIFSFWHSSERFYPGLNLSLYDNKKVDALLESIRKNPDENTREQDLAKLQRLISEDKPAIFLYSPAYLYVGPKNLGGFEENIITTPSKRFQNISKWYLDTKKVFK